MSRNKMAFDQRFFLLSIVALKTLGLVIENTFTTPNIETKNFHYVVDFWQYVVDVNKYGLDLTGITTMTFEVKACGGASIVMSNSEVGDPKKPLYNLIIGGENNTKSTIKVRLDDSLQPTSQRLISDQTPDVCKCNEYRPFWISVKNGEQWIGTGRIVGKSAIIGLNYPHFIIRGIGIYTNQENIGDWRVQIEVLNKLFDGSFLQCSTNYKAVLDIILEKKSSLLQCAVMCYMIISCIGHNFHYQSSSAYVYFDWGCQGVFENRIMDITNQKVQIRTLNMTNRTGLFSYQSVGRRCELVTFSPGYGVVKEIPKKHEDGWKFYTKCYRYNRACLWCHF